MFLSFCQLVQGEPLGSLPSMQYGSDIDTLDETDSGSTPDPTRTRHHIEETLRKIERTKEQIKAEQKVKDGKIKMCIKYM